jgi:hypothetical protein
MKTASLCLLLLLCSSIAVRAGLVEPCSKWKNFPVKICKGTNQIKNKYMSSVKHDDRSVKGRKDFLKEIAELNMVTSNAYLNGQDELWKFSKDLISNEFSKEKTGISFEFLETDDLSKCDSVLFLTDMPGYGGYSRVGDRSGYKETKNPNFKTNSKQKAPSFSIVESSEVLIEGVIMDHINRKFETNYKMGSNLDEKYQLYKTQIALDVFKIVFKNYLIHEIGHLSGLRHSHAYKDVKKQDPNASIEKKGKTAVDVCGFDQTSIMNYGFLNEIEKYGLEIKNYINGVIPPVCPNHPDLVRTGLSENDMKSLRCLYGVGTSVDQCPTVHCKY